MAFDYACFVSYRHREQSQLAEKFINDLCAALRNELAALLDEEIFIDRERMRGGIFFNAALARALCKSICMVLIYTPTYFSRQHLYCTREFRAMEQLETIRLRRLSKTLSSECGLIIPVVLRGASSLPSNIRINRHFYNFEGFSLTSRDMARNRQFKRIIREIADAIHERKLMFDLFGEDLTVNCGDFSFPSDDEILPWLDEVASPTSPFPWTWSETPGE